MRSGKEAVEGSSTHMDQAASNPASQLLRHLLSGSITSISVQLLPHCPIPGTLLISGIIQPLTFHPFTSSPYSYMSLVNFSTPAYHFSTYSLFIHQAPPSLPLHSELDGLASSQHFKSSTINRPLPMSFNSFCLEKSHLSAFSRNTF